jgi:small subunit ribosomal protein S16
MAVKIRLARRGRKKRAVYDVVIADARSPRDGRFIEKIGVYNPNTDPAHVDINDDRAFHWVMNGAQPTDTVRAMLSYRGILMKKHLQIGVIKGAITQEQADEKLEAWKEQKEQQIASRIEGIEKKNTEEARKRKEAESKVRAAREEAIRARQKKEEEAAAAEAAEAAGEQEESATEEATETAAEAEAPAEEQQSNVEEAKEEVPAEAEKEESSDDKKE